MTSYESLHIFKLIKILIPYNFLTLWNFFLQFSTFFKIKQYQLFPMISMHVEKQCSSPLKERICYFLFASMAAETLLKWVPLLKGMNLLPYEL